MIDWTETQWKDRAEYLADLSLEYDSETVEILADILGDSELFDGLLNALEDGY